MNALLSGAAIGFAIAMPVGPIGLLCIKRSLNDGFKAGLATGLGAATADASYGMLVALGFGLSGLLSQAEALKIGGGLLIVFLGLMSLRQFFRPARRPEIVALKGGMLTMWLGAYMLTLTNPMTILAFVGLIAGLGTASMAAPYLLVLGVFLGSLLWWLILVQGVLLVKSRLSLAVLRWLDFISGMALVLWGGWIAASAAFLP